MFSDNFFVSCREAFKTYWNSPDAPPMALVDEVGAVVEFNTSFAFLVGSPTKCSEMKLEVIKDHNGYAELLLGPDSAQTISFKIIPSENFRILIGVKVLFTEANLVSRFALLHEDLVNTTRELHKKNIALEEARDQIRTLSGIIPICASCKNIRDDGGYWNMVESYISKHTDAEFSHGICPDCMKKLYPEYCDEDL